MEVGAYVQRAQRRQPAGSFRAGTDRVLLIALDHSPNLKPAVVAFRPAIQFVFRTLTVASQFAGSRRAS